MNNLFKNFFLFLFLLASGEVLSQEVDSFYQVADWQGFRTSAVSFTFDDGTPKHFTVAIPMFDEYNFKLTLFTVVNWSSGNWNALHNAALNGHEVASHTITHPYLNTLSAEQQTIELKNSKDQINNQVPGEQCITIAYPYCVAGDYTLCSEYYIAARGCSGSIEPKTPSDFLNISSIVCGPEGNVKTAQDFNNRANTAATSKGWVVFLLHGVDNDGGWSPVVSDTLRAALEYLNSNPLKFWVSSFGNVVRYIRERNSASVVELSATDSLITCEVSDTLENEIYDFPITIKRELPVDWISAIISQGDSVVESQVVEIDSKKYIMFDAVPDKGEIRIKESSTTGVNDYDNYQPRTPYLMQNYPNPFNPSTRIVYLIPKVKKGKDSSSGQKTMLRIYDVLGNEVSTLVNVEKAPGTYEIIFDAAGLSSGIYFYKLSTGVFSETKKMILLY